MAKKSVFDDSQSRGYAIRIVNDDVARRQGITASRNITGILDKDFMVQAVVEVDFLPPTGNEGVLYVLPSGEMAIWRAGSQVWQIVGGGGGGSSITTRPINVTTVIGAYKGGETIPAGTQLEDILANILTTVNTPAFTAPSATIAGTGAKLIEKGDTSNETITINFNRGSINPPYGTSGFRAGQANSYTMNGSSQATNTFNVVVSETNNRFSGSVAYDEGEQPKDSAGNNFDSPLPAGSVNTSNQVNYEFVNAFYSTLNDVDTLDKMPLVSYSRKYYEIQVCQTYGPGRWSKVDVPAELNNVVIKIWNALSNQWVISANPNEWKSTGTVTHTDAAGRTVDYVRYEDGRNGGSASRAIRVEWS